MPKFSKKATTGKGKKAGKPPTSSRNAPKASRPDTKSALILKLLGRTNGATVKELAAATNWQDHSIRGYLSGTLKKKMGLLVTGEVFKGIRHYKLDRQDKLDRQGTGQ